jgi:hypothetical protein
MDDPGVVIVDLGPYQPADSDAVGRLQKGARAPIIVLSGQVSGIGRGAKARCPGQPLGYRFQPSPRDSSARPERGHRCRAPRRELRASPECRYRIRVVG